MDKSKAGNAATPSTCYLGSRRDDSRDICRVHAQVLREVIPMSEPTSEFRHHFVDTNGIRMHVAEAGEGYPVVMCHGFPELWYSWRHQMRALANAAFRAVAPDQRGYGETGGPE